MEFSIKILVVAILGLVTLLMIVMIAGGLLGNAETKAFDFFDWFSTLTGGG